MRSTLLDRLYKRELGDRSNYSKIPGIYGDKKWVQDLDIVNELGGHSGCVNALSWSTSGRLLASGSDDLHVNIFSYLPDSSSSQFAHSTTISTGHTQNVFSVKFMPHSNDRTIVSAAGDCEVRLFDIEYAGRSSTGGAPDVPSPPRRLNGLNTVFDGVRYLGERDTNAKVFRCHSDRVKRIVTESSPYFFLTCSEDGEVRQWDIRQPSSAYPSHHRGRGGSGGHVPPALISYKKYHLDLNSISCSPSQPHYIALGGAHLHCFLHDRRMLGRDKLAEQGRSVSAGSSDRDNDLLGQATHCVKRFAPNGQNRMKRHDNGHITACKISNANPNEMIVSWSGDHIYSFDLLRSPDATELPKEAVSHPSTLKSGNTRARESRLRKRKRPKSGSVQSRAGTRQRTESETESGGQEGLSLMVQYENGQSEEIPLEASIDLGPLSEAQAARLSEPQRQCFRIAKLSVKMRQRLFISKPSNNPSDTDPTGYGSSFSLALGIAASILPDMNEIMSSWRYPVNPSEVDVAIQNHLRTSRASAWRFVQAAGVACRVLGGRIRTASGSGDDIALKYFAQITPAPNEQTSVPPHERFCYDFLKAILLWLECGPGALIEGFTRSGRIARNSNRFPIGRDAPIEAIDDTLIPYLLQLANSNPIIDVETSRFEVDENRIAFPSQKAAVLAFARAVKIPFADLSSSVVPTPAEDENGASASSSMEVAAQHRRAAFKFWGLKIGRSILMTAGREVNFAFVDRSFGGLGQPDAEVTTSESTLASQQEEIDVNEPEEIVAQASIRRVLHRHRQRGEGSSAQQATVEDAASIDDDEDEGEDEDEEYDGLDTVMLDEDDEDNDDNDDDDDEDDDDADGDSDGDAEQDDPEDSDMGTPSDDEIEGLLGTRFTWRSAYERRQLREGVEADAPCVPHSRVYQGHCNVKTVKDVNFFGLQDEYIVSGSDSGHVFIWDKKTSQRLNILEGDGEVANVVQGHPYEPMLAVSGIDHSIKIFSSDHRARDAARRGDGIAASDSSTFTRLGFGRSRLRRAHRRTNVTSEPAVEEPVADDSDYEAELRVAANGLKSRRRIHQEYEIVRQNEMDRRGGNRDATITRTMLLQVAAYLRQRRNNGGQMGEGVDDGDNNPSALNAILLNDDCTVM